MFLPIGDEPNEHHTPWVNYGLIAANVAVFLFLTPDLGREDSEAAKAFYFRWGYLPSAPRAETLFTCMFLHGGFLHLFGNMLYLWIFGDNCEARLGRVRYLLSYLATGAIGTLAFALFNPDGEVPLVGASGAISGVQGVYFLAFPRNRVKVLVMLFYFWDVWHLSARWIIGFWFVVNDLLPLAFRTHLLGDMTAHQAHLGGFASGLVAYLLIRPFVRDREDRFRSEAEAGRTSYWGHRDPYAGGRTAPPGWADGGAAPAIPDEEAILALWRGGRFTQAADLFAERLRMGVVPPVPEPEFFRAAAYLYDQGKFDDARRAFHAFLLSFPSSRNAPAASFALGMIYSRRDRDVPQARIHLEEALRRHPDPAVRELARRELAGLGYLR